jgi:hypothetical protein
MSSKSRWHEAARVAIQEMLPSLSGTAAAKKNALLADPPDEFRTGYPRKVWEYEAMRATTGLPRRRGATYLGEWPMTAEQKAFFDE